MISKKVKKMLKESKENLKLVGANNKPTISITWSDIWAGLLQKTPIMKLDQNQEPVYIFVGK